MSKEDKPPPSPNHGLFDPSQFLGAPSLGLAGLSFPHLAHLPAFPWLARPPMLPPSLFGLGAIPNPLLAAAHGLPPTAADYGGAEWWRAASEHARRVARSSGVDFFAASLGGPPPPLTALGLESTPTGLEFLLAAPTEGDASAALFGMSKHLSEYHHTSTPSPSPSRRSRTSTPTPSPAHQKSSTSKSSHASSTSSSTSSSSKVPGYPPQSADSKGSWHVNGSAFSLKSLTSSDPSSSRKRRHKDEKSPATTGPSSLFTPPSGSAATTSRSSVPTTPSAAHTPHRNSVDMTAKSLNSSASRNSDAPRSSNATAPRGSNATASISRSSDPAASRSSNATTSRSSNATASRSSNFTASRSFDATASRSSVDLTFRCGASERGDGNGALNLTKPSPVTTGMKLPPAAHGAQDLSVKKPSGQSKATNGTHVMDSDSPDVSTPGSDVSDDSDNDMEKGDRSGDRKSGHQIDLSKRQQLADQIRQQLMSGVPAPSPLATPLVIPSLRFRRGKEKEQKKGSASHNASPYSLLNLSHEYPPPEAYFTDRELLGLAAASSSHDASPHSAALSYLSSEHLRLNHQSRDDSQDSLHSYQLSEADDSKFETSGSERPMDSESGWGSDEDGSHTSPGPSGDDPSRKRAIVLNERELLIPLEHGWQRQTTIHGMGRRGIVGEVVYYAPCTKKMKTIPDVMRYLDRHGITDLSRENFTFNTKVNVGQFFEVRDNKVVPLSEVEIQERIAMSKGKRARMQMLARKKCEKQLRQQALAKQVMEAKLKRRQEQQEMAQKAAEMKFQMRLEKEQQREMAKKVREVRLIERQREKEQARMMKQQEKVRQQEQLRVEREMRAQQIIESNLLWLQSESEREMKKQQHVVEKEQERERRRQHLLLVKALEQQKKEEERLEKERQREQKIREKNIERERKMAQRQMEMFIASEMKKPMDDMELRDGKPLPEFPRCPETRLAGPAFSDCLMIVEFVNNFADALGLDPDGVPTLDKLQNGLLGSNDEDVEDMVTLYLHLLRFALDDLGVPNPKEAMTMLNQKITDLEINDATMSEVTRLFLRAHGEKKMSEWLEKIPLEALNPTKKAAIIAFLCNELLSSKRISGEIEKTLETINTLRRDKWVAEGKLRKLRTVRARKYMRIEHLHQSQPPPPDDDSMTNTTVNSSKAASEDEEEKEEEGEEEEDESDESDVTHTTGRGSEDEDDGLTKEDMDKKIDRLVKQHNSYDSKVADVSRHLRGTCLGQDRYKRLYWILPATGGIFVEGIESGETEALAFEAELQAKQQAKKAAEEGKVKKEEPVIKAEKVDCESVKMEEMTQGKSQEGHKMDANARPSGKPVETGDSKLEVKTETVEKNTGKTVKEESAAIGTEHKKLTATSDGVSGACVKAEKSMASVNGCLSVSQTGDSKSQVNSVCDLPTHTPNPTSQAAELSTSAFKDLSASTDADKSLKTDTEKMDIGTVRTDGDESVKDTENRGKLDSAADGTKVSSASSHSSLLFQEPILSKLTDLLKLPQSGADTQGSQTVSSGTARTLSCTVQTSSGTLQTSGTHQTLLAIPQTLSVSSPVVSLSVTSQPSSAVTPATTVSTVMTAASKSTVAETILNTGTTILSSKQPSFEGTAEVKSSPPPPPQQQTLASTSHISVLSDVPSLASLSVPSSVLSCTSSAASVTASSVVASSVVSSTVNSTVSQGPSASHLHSSQSSPVVTQEVCVTTSEVSTPVMAKLNSTPEVCTPVMAKSDSSTTSPTMRKTLSFTSTTILSSTPISLLSSGMETAMTPTLTPASKTVTDTVSTPASLVASVTVSTSGPAVSTPVLTNQAAAKEGNKEKAIGVDASTKVLASTPTTSSSVSFPSHVVSLLSGLPITSPIQASSTLTTGSKKSNFISIDALLKKEPGTDASPSVASSTTTANGSTMGARPTLAASLTMGTSLNMATSSTTGVSSTIATSLTSATSSTTGTNSTTTTTNSSSAKNHASTNNHFLPPSLFPPSPLVSDYFLKSYADILDQKPWFSILPRLPCDSEGSKTEGSVPSTPGRLGVVSADNIASASLSLLSLLPMHAMHQAQAQSQALGAQTPSTPSHSQTNSLMQTPSQTMGNFASAFQACLSQSGFSDTSSISISANTLDMDSFKVPAPPSDSILWESFGDLDPMAVLQKIQGEAQPIPISKQRGWWKISDVEQVRLMYRRLLSRGVREKNMAYSLRKYMELCEQVCAIDSGQIITIKTEVEEPTQNKSVEKLTEGDKQSDSTAASNTDKTQPEAEKTQADSEKAQSSLEKPQSDLEKTQTDLEKTQSGSNKTQLDSAEAQPESEKTAVKVKEEKMDVNEEENKRKMVPMEVDSEDIDDAIPADPEDSWNVKAGFEVEMACLEDVEALEDRIFNASLQVKQAWKLPQRATEDPEIRMVDRSVENPTPPDCYPMDVARNRLLLLESNIERRYLKPPLMRNVPLHFVNIAPTPETSRSDRSGAADKSADSDQSAADTLHEQIIEIEDVPPGLMLWRRAVHSSVTPAQLNLCTQLLGSSIAWEKSIMKVTCQICLKDDNEAELLLCDGCDKGYHTYCFKPKMETIPDGDWYCYECVTKASGVAHCIVCGQKVGKIVVCERCPRAIHTDCLDPPLPRMPKKWQCASCLTSKSKKSTKRKRKEAPPPALTQAAARERKDSVTSSTRERRDSESAADVPPPEKKKKESAKEKKGKAKEEKKKEEKNEKKTPEKKEKKESPEKKRTKKKKGDGDDAKSKESDLSICGKLLTELEKSDDGWPFLKPVSTKQFPSYKKFIAQPMDFHTMKGKLRDKTYKHRSEFAADVHLILNNCETFNEDDSEVGLAGHSLRKFFRQRWRELFSEDS